MKDVIIIAGPTGVGKTKLSIQLAKELNTEIISCDSMQIYKGLDIGTGKIKTEEMQGIKHYMLDVVEPSENYSVQEYKNEAVKLIEQIHSKKLIPIIVGGTGLYIDSLTHNFDFANVKPDYNLRNELEQLYTENPNKLLEMVHNIDPNQYKDLTVKDKKKLIRAYEVFEKSGKLIDYSRVDKNSEYNYHLFVLTDNREVLYERINNRVDQMIKEGLVEEVKSILHNGVTQVSQSMKAIGYKEVIEYLNGEINYDEMISSIKQNSRRYAKRQLTWFRRNEYSNWISLEDYSFDEIKNIILESIKKL